MLTILSTSIEPKKEYCKEFCPVGMELSRFHVALDEIEFRVSVSD